MPTVTATPIPSDWPLPPTNPVSVIAYVDFLTDFINAQPINYDHDDNFELARQLSGSAINAQPPLPAIGIEGSDLQLTIAIARFQAIYTALLAGDNPTAQMLYDQAQQNDGDYGKWTAAFMPIHQQTNDLAAACLSV